MSQYYSNGKLLVTGEYLVLDGALALALPTKFGQSLSVSKIQQPFIEWESYDHRSRVWFSSNISVNEIFSGIKTVNNKIEGRLISILREAQKLNPDFLKNDSGYKIKTNLTFPKDWGLGTSSTLINNIAQWAKVDPYQLLNNTFGGSGYDIACANSRTPILYKLKNGKAEVCTTEFDPPFRENLYFVYLNRKQDSREGISEYRKKQNSVSKEIETITSLSRLILKSQTLEEFSTLIDAHENLISKLIDIDPIKTRLFNDFDGTMKSLGAWGGDFIMVASKKNPIEYFRGKGLETVLRFDEMIL